MHVWFPDAAAAKAETALLHERAYQEILSSLAQAMPSGTGSKEVAQLLDKPPHPLLFQWCFEARERLGTQGAYGDGLTADIDHVVGQVDASLERVPGNERRFGMPVDVAAPPLGMNATIQRALAMAHAANGVECTLEVLTEIDDELAATLNSATTILMAYWPNMHAEILALLRQLFLFRSEKVIGFVDFRSHGAIWLRESAIREPLQLAEELIHEVSHVRLNVSHAIRPLFLNDDSETYTSPLRRDPRSMFGVFHQMFVLRRLHAFYRRVADIEGSGPASLRNGRTIAERVVVIEANLGASMEIVRAHGKLTREGKQLLESIEALDADG